MLVLFNKLIWRKRFSLMMTGYICLNNFSQIFVLTFYKKTTTKPGYVNFMVIDLHKLVV